MVSHLETRITFSSNFFLSALLPLHNSLIVLYQLGKTVHDSMYSIIRVKYAAVDTFLFLSAPSPIDALMLK